jgi:hypothetical protein
MDGLRYVKEAHVSSAQMGCDLSITADRSEANAGRGDEAGLAGGGSLCVTVTGLPIKK